jgi:hypothetical protein
LYALRPRVPGRIVLMLFQADPTFFP